VCWQVNRPNDPTSAKVSNILGSYDKVKELVSSSRMIGAVLQPATPRPSDAPAPLLPPPAAASRSHHRKHARTGLRPEPSRQGVFEQFQPSSSGVVSADQVRDEATDTVLRGRCEKTTDRCSGSSTHVVNGRHKSATAAASGDSKHHRHKLAIPTPEVCRPNS